MQHLGDGATWPTAKRTHAAVAFAEHTTGQLFLTSPCHPADDGEGPARRFPRRDLFHRLRGYPGKVKISLRRWELLRRAKSPSVRFTRAARAVVSGITDERELRRARAAPALLDGRGSLSETQTVRFFAARGHPTRSAH